MTSLIDKRLKTLIRALGKPPKVQLGILGKKTNRTDTGLTNATIGAAHEFGAPNRRPPLPMRSFLRMPLNEHFEGKLKESKSLTKKTMRQATRDGDLKNFMEKIGIVGEAVVREAFDTGGYGKWKPLAASTMRHKTVNQILVETTQLRESISSRVVKDDN